MRILGRDAAEALNFRGAGTLTDKGPQQSESGSGQCVSVSVCVRVRGRVCSTAVGWNSNASSRLDLQLQGPRLQAFSRLSDSISAHRLHISSFLIFGIALLESSHEPQKGTTMGPMGRSSGL